MNKYLKEFFHRGLLFGGFGPIVMGIIYLILSYGIDGFSIEGREAFWAILSTYLLAFVHAGASIFNQIESWPISKSLLFHFTTLYFAYTICYLVNSWIPFNIRFLGVFTAIFVVVYFIVWITVYIAVKTYERRLNARLK